MADTVFKCSRCGYATDTLYSFKRHLSKKKECPPKLCDISRQELKKRIMQKITIRNFGKENIEFIKKDVLKTYVQDPLRGLQDIIRMIYFNKYHEENRTIRTITSNEDEAKIMVEIYVDEGWHKKEKTKIYDRIIYKVAAIMEDNIFKKDRTPEFQKFINSMNEMDNDDLLELIREEVDDTIISAENDLTK